MRILGLLVGAAVAAAPGCTIQPVQPVRSQPPITMAAMPMGTGSVLPLKKAPGPLLRATPEHAALVSTYCVACHNDRLKTAGLSLQSLDLNNIPAHAEVWEKVVRKVRSGEMPPVNARA